MKIIVNSSAHPERVPVWMPLVANAEDPAILLLLPETWAELERERAICRETIQGKNILMMHKFIPRLVALCRPEAWRGFETPEGEEAGFSPESLVNILLKNEALATLFLAAIGNALTEALEREVKLVKNSDAGRDTPDITPSSTKTAKN